MHRWMTAVAICATIGCSSGPAAPQGQSAPSTFSGAWRSTTSSLDFVRLTVGPRTAAQDVLAARLTFSGVAWEGDGGIAGDSLVVAMSMPGSITPTGVLVAHSTDTGTLRVRLSPDGGVPLNMTFVRDTP
jgi:hypothetical protein